MVSSADHSEAHDKWRATTSIIDFFCIEFLLGSTFLVAPVIEEGAVTRDIYLPKGIWLDEKNAKYVKGPIWLMDYAAPLDVLPYFRRYESHSGHTNQRYGKYDSLKGINNRIWAEKNVFVYEYDLQIVHYQVLDVFKCCDTHCKDNNIWNLRLIVWLMELTFKSSYHHDMTIEIGRRWWELYSDIWPNISETRKCVRPWTPNVLSRIFRLIDISKRIAQICIEKKCIICWNSIKQCLENWVCLLSTSFKQQKLFVYEFSVNYARARSSNDSSDTYEMQ